MQSHQETPLATLPAGNDDERLLVVLCCPAGQASHLELRQQSWGEGVGWFTQGSVRVEPHQVAQLRNALGTHSSGSAQRASTAAWSSDLSATREHYPRVLRADSA